ncbi:FAD-dependent oxidoreductase [bacterium]|nr:FAD-dependent oxidoreductase [bacterium]
MFKKLFETGKIGRLELANRMIMSPMLTCYTDGEFVSDRYIAYLAARAQGGVGLITTEVAHVHPLGRLEPNELAIHDDKFLPGLKKLTEAIHAKGAKIAMQIGHGGHRCNSKLIGQQPISASNIAGIWGEEPRPMTIDEIKGLVADFAAAAARAEKAGFDGVELHFAHGYLVRQFLSPYTNKRGDEYGGDLHGRTRLASEIMAAVRQRVGDFPVWARINGDDFLPEGQTHEDAKFLAALLEKNGADAIDVSAGTYESAQWSTQPMFLPQGCLAHLAAGIKGVVSVPVITVGRINTPEFAEQTLTDGKADFVALGRALIADPDFPRKAAEGRGSDIRRCIADNACIDRLIFGGLVCTVNAEVGREAEYQISSAVKPKKVMVAGGGPAGLEAARVAALRGHQVTLYERTGTLGGQVKMADRSPLKGEMRFLIADLVDQVQKLGVQIKLDTPVDSALINEANPDVLIIATGSKIAVPDIPGIDQDNVVTAHDLLADKVTTRQKVAVLGGGRVGIEVAELLSEQGKEITIVERLKRVGHDLGVSYWAASMAGFKKHGVRLLAKAEIQAIEGDTVIVNKEGEKIVVEAETIVLALGVKPVKDLEEAITGTIEYHMIGDCVKPLSCLEAIGEGARIARII